MKLNPNTQELTLTIEELSTAIASALKEVRVYVLESDISDAQRAVKTVVEQANIAEL